MNKQRIAILMLSSVGVLATFMPWSSLPLLGAMSGINVSIGKISLVLFLVPLLLSLVGDKNKDVKESVFWVIVALSVLTAILDSLYIVILKTQGSADEDPLGRIIAENMSIGFGVYTAILAAILLPMIAVLMKDSKIRVKAIPVRVVQTVAEKNYSASPVISVMPVSKKEDDDKSGKDDHSRFMPK